MRFRVALGISLTTLLSGCIHPQEVFNGVSEQDAAECRLRVAQAMGPNSESLVGTLDQLGPRRALMRDCLVSLGYQPTIAR